MTKTALIDGDIILYSVGFASEERHYVITDLADSVVHQCQYAKDANTLLEHNPDYTKELHRSPVHASHWKGNTNTLIRNILSKSGCDDYRVLLTGEGNFREKLVSNYKANRTDTPKPLMFEEMKAWLITRHNAEVIDGREADDELATLGYCNVNAVICTIDKDLKMVPGYHYNWLSKETYTVKYLDGLRWFFKQLLMGDTADNIIGLKGVGIKTAEKLIDVHNSAQEMYNVCADLYLSKERTLAELHINGHLLWMQRTGPDCKWDKYLKIDKREE